MKRLLLICTLIAVWATQFVAQTTVQLNIHHKLAEMDFAMNIAAKNNMNHEFSFDRLEYYISEITLVHDGGQETLIENLHILAEATSTTKVELGSFDIESVEQIQFHIGVDPDHNHLDPSSYHAAHPLAPKSPSMHWGWAAGYRFVALEGKGGSGLNQNLELHGLGDTNYFSSQVDLDVSADNNNLVTIDLDADYTRALENIAVNSGIIVHGDQLQAKQCLENFRDLVFSPSDNAISTVDFTEVSNFDVFPNPAGAGQTTIKLQLNDNGNNYDLAINSVLGRQILYQEAINDGTIIDLTNLTSGIYFVNLIKEGQIIITEQLIVK